MGGLASSTYRTRIQWADTDASGHHHNSVVMRCVEAAEAELMRERGLTGYFQTAPRVRQEISFEARLFFGQEITATVWVSEIGNSSMTFEFEVWGEEHGSRGRARAAFGRFVTVHVPQPGSSAQPWPTAWRQVLTGPARRSDRDEQSFE